MIISVDTGNKHMKTENCEFNSGVEILDTPPEDNKLHMTVCRLVPI